jgi:hypothetical protein
LLSFSLYFTSCLKYLTRCKNHRENKTKNKRRIKKLINFLKKEKTEKNPQPQWCWFGKNISSTPLFIEIWGAYVSLQEKSPFFLA